MFVERITLKHQTSDSGGIFRQFVVLAPVAFEGTKELTEPVGTKVMFLGSSNYVARRVVRVF